MTDKWKEPPRERTEYVTRSRERNSSSSVLTIQFYFASSDVWRLVKFAYPHCREFFVAGSEDKFRARRLRLPPRRAKFHLEEVEILARWQIELQSSSSVRKVQNSLR